MKNESEYGRPDTTYQGLLGEKQFRRFIKLRDYATKTIGMECNGFTAKTRRGNYYLGFMKVYKKDQNHVIDSGSLYFSLNPHFFNVEIYGSMKLWERVVQNKDTFCKDVQADIEFILSKNWSLEKVPINAKIGKEDSFQDAMRLLKWMHEEHMEEDRC